MREEKPEIISSYTQMQAIDDGYLYKVADLSNGKTFVITVGIKELLNEYEVMEVYKEFWAWKINEEWKLPEAEKMFVTYKKETKIWMVEDGNGYTLMLPEEY